MLEKSKLYLKAIKKYWIFIFAIIVIAISFANLPVAIWIALIALIVYLASWIPSIMFSRNFKKLMKEYKTIDDITISKKVKKPLNKIQERMFILSQKQNNKDIFVRGYLTQNIPISRKKTFYTLYGNVFVYICIAEALAVIALAFIRVRRIP